MSIYKACDIRGDAEAELSPTLYRQWGFALGTRRPPGAEFVVGGDVRASTPTFRAAFVDGLRRAGAAVADLGIVPTPMVYFANRARDARACAIVTASHSPPHVNGLKWMLGDLPPTERDVEALGRAIPPPEGSGGEHPAGSYRTLDVDADYGRWLRARWGGRGHAAGRVVVDPGGGCWSGRAVTCLAGVFPGIEFAAIHDRPDPGFTSRGPDCARPEHLAKLADAVTARDADLGIAFDGDGDRVAFVDNQGVALTPEQATWILLQTLADDLRGRPFVYDLKFSDRVPQAAAGMGACPIAERSGHAFIRTTMIRRAARFGAEMSGHYFDEELGGGDDALYTACRIIDCAVRSAAGLADLRGRFPAVHVTPDLRLAVDGPRDEVIAEVRAAFDRYPQSFVDGVRIDFPGGWALVRGSITERKLTFRFEGESRRRLDQIVAEFCDALGELGRRLRKQHRTH